MTDDERLHPTAKSKTIEAGKIAGSLSSIVVCLGAVWGFTGGPVQKYWQQFKDTVDIAAVTQTGQRQIQKEQQQILLQLTNVVEQQTELISRVETLESGREIDDTPCINFTRRGHSISDGRVGETVVMTWAFVKLRECGRPNVVVSFRNGGNRVHNFEDISVESNGRGISVPADRTMAQTLTYTARIPADQAVLPGRAYGWVQISYPDVPQVAVQATPETAFEILRSDKKPH